MQITLFVLKAGYELAQALVIAQVFVVIVRKGTYVMHCKFLAPLSSGLGSWTSNLGLSAVKEVRNISLGKL